MSTLQVFAQEINAIGQNIIRNSVRLQRTVAEHVVEFVATQTPIDTGRASGNWITQIGSPDTGYDPNETGGPQTSIDRAKAALAALAVGQTVYISNNVPYIVPLNQGTSSQAPAGFVEMSAVSALQVAANFNLLIR